MVWKTWTWKIPADEVISINFELTSWINFSIRPIKTFSWGLQKLNVSHWTVRLSLLYLQLLLLLGQHLHQRILLFFVQYHSYQPLHYTYIFSAPFPVPIALILCSFLRLSIRLLQSLIFWFFWISLWYRRYPFFYLFRETLHCPFPHISSFAFLFLDLSFNLVLTSSDSISLSISSSISTSNSLSCTSMPLAFSSDRVFFRYFVEIKLYLSRTARCVTTKPVYHIAKDYPQSFAITEFELLFSFWSWTTSQLVFLYTWRYRASQSIP